MFSTRVSKLALGSWALHLICVGIITLSELRNERIFFLFHNFSQPFHHYEIPIRESNFGRRIRNFIFNNWTFHTNAIPLETSRVHKMLHCEPRSGLIRMSIEIIIFLISASEEFSPVPLNFAQFAGTDKINSTVKWLWPNLTLFGLSHLKANLIGNESVGLN